MYGQGKAVQLIAGGLLLCVVLLFPGSARALEWTCIQGSAGNVEFPSRIATTDAVHIGWGLDFYQASNSWNWIHFAIPTRAGDRMRHIALEFLTGSSDAVVESVHVYNLGTRVMEFNNLGWKGAKQVKVLDLGAARRFTALSLAVNTVTGSTILSHQFVFTGACASVIP